MEVVVMLIDTAKIKFLHYRTNQTEYYGNSLLHVCDIRSLPDVCLFRNVSITTSYDINS